MRVVITGASGNAGSSLIEALAGENRVDSILGLARRRPPWKPPKTEWVVADVSRDDLAPHFAGADAVIHLAWLIQPSRDPSALRATNVLGTEKVLRAVTDAKVPTLVYASSVGAYSPGPKDRQVDEGWQTGGIPTSFYSRHKAEVERLLDRFEQDVETTRVVRFRPALIFKGESASEIRRLFAGPFMPPLLADRRWIPFVPRISGLRFQAVHSADVGDAYRRSLLADVRGAFNLAAEPVLDPERLGDFLGARPVPVSARLVRGLTGLTWRLRLQPTPPGWVDMALNVPLMDSARARRELGWEPGHSALDALGELLRGMREGRGLPTPPLDPDDGGHSRAEELRTGVGAE
jgi:UDP-glucose 4-epimerase